MMPKPNKHSNNQNNHKSGFEGFNSERVLVETKPNMMLYVDNFILKIVLLFLMVFMFAPIITFIHEIQLSLTNSFNLVLPNMTFIGELVLIFLIIVLLAKIVLDLLDWDNTLYILTDSRIVIQRGFFNKEKIMMSYSKIQDLDVSQSVLERIFNVGDIVIYGANDNSETILYDIPKPKEVEEIIFNRANNSGYNSNYNPYPNNQGYSNQYGPNSGYQSQYGSNQSYQNQQNPNIGYGNSNYQQDMVMEEQNYRNQNKEPYNKNNYGQPEDNSHYFDVEETYVNEDYEPISKGYKEKWQNTKGTYNKKEISKEEVFRRHEEMFKKHNK